MQPNTLNTMNSTKQKARFLTVLRDISVDRGWKIGVSWEVCGERKAICGTPQSESREKMGRASLVEKEGSWKDRGGIKMSRQEGSSPGRKY